MNNEIKREFQIPATLEHVIDDNLKKLGTSLSDSKRLAECIQWQSDYYIQNLNHPTPWNEKRAQIAQWAYYLPLNFLRNLSVVNELKSRVPLSHFSGAFDYGAGLGASSWALRESGYLGPITLYDKHPLDLAAVAAVGGESAKSIEARHHHAHLGLFSYSLTEIPNRDDLLNQFSYIVILEPSTQAEGRRLSETRRLLVNNDYEILAPCTHQKDCPLLVHSQKDWCHDRILFKKPQWMNQIEKHLPFRNDSLTFSYLIAFKKSVMNESWRLPSIPLLGRLTGDILPEKGKDKQLVCFDERRLFLAWLHKTKIDQTLPRGGKVELPEPIDVVANEVRLKNKIKYLP